MGIYVHIPFCRSKCFYCGFYSVASLKLKDPFVDALCREIDIRHSYIGSNKIDTLYFGGGTPSLLTLADFERILRKLHEYYIFNTGGEITCEINPEDMNHEKLKALKSMGINRLSVGVQTLQDDILKKINRTHSALEAVQGILRAAEEGFTNISVDLIIGLPGQTPDSLEADLSTLVCLPGVVHVSVYILSIEPDSVLERQYKKGVFQPQDEEMLAGNYEWVSAFLKAQGFEHYEISNFARDGKYSRHNVSYWQQKEYVGFGPAAHSYDGISRQWNISHIKSYIDALYKNILFFDREELNEKNKYNEYVMTSLRTCWGADLQVLEKEFPEYYADFQKNIEIYKKTGMACVENGHLKLSTKGWLVSDEIFRDLFVV